MESGLQSSQNLSTFVQEPPQSPDVAEVNSGSPRYHGAINFWCYLCSKVVSAEPERPGDNSVMVCSDCHGGFIEAMTAAQSLPDVHRSRHRRRRRGGSSGQSVESLESVYSNHVSQFLQLLGQNSHENAVFDQGHRSDQEHDAGRIVVTDDQASHPPITRPFRQRRAASEMGSEGYDHIESFLGDSDTNITFSGHGTLLGESDTNITFSGHGANSDFSGDVLGDGQNFLDGDMFLIHQDDESHADGDSESGIETVHAGRYDWDSMDENDDGEWDAGGEDEYGGVEGREGMGETRGASSAEESSEQTDYRSQQRSRRTRWDIRRHQRRRMNFEINLREYIPGIFENLGGNNSEASLELHDGPFYVGNPGDYLDARGFEQLLQHLAETDNSRRGAPPAAQSSIEKLPLIFIEKAHEEDGTSVCAICKDSLALGDQAKQLPCMHLYHPDCILPWLSARNSCPVCRYELPTDDPEYEEERRNAFNRSNHNYHEHNFTREIYSEISTNTEELENIGTEQQIETESLLETSRTVGSVADFDEELDSEGITYHAMEEERVAREHALVQEMEHEITESFAESKEVAASQTSSRGWFFLAAGPVISVVGLVLVLCFGNRLIGGRIQNDNTQQYFQNSHIQQVVPNGENNRRRWWNLFRR